MFGLFELMRGTALRNICLACPSIPGEELPASMDGSTHKDSWTLSNKSQMKSRFWNFRLLRKPRWNTWRGRGRSLSALVLCYHSTTSLLLPSPCISQSHWVHEWAEAVPTTVTLGRIAKQNELSQRYTCTKLNFINWQPKMLLLRYTSILTQMSRFLLRTSVLIFSTTVLRLDLILSDISSVRIRVTIDVSGHVKYHTYSLYLMLPALAATTCNVLHTTTDSYNMHTSYRCSRIWWTTVELRLTDNPQQRTPTI